MSLLSKPDSDRSIHRHDGVFTYASCSFYLREKVEGGYRYTMLYYPSGMGRLDTTMPPQVGDRLYLDEAGMCVVVDRQWSYPMLGSGAWPFQNEIRQGPLVDVVVEVSTGVFIDEVPDEERPVSSEEKNA